MFRKILRYSFLFYLTFSFGQGKNDGNDLKFNEIKNVLADEWVSNVWQDKDGFIWAATQDGLYKYNGKSFKAFRYNPLDSNTLPANWVRDIDQDKNGMFWIGTYGSSLVTFDEKRGAFEKVEIDAKNPGSNTLIIFEVFISSSSAIWALTEDGLYRKSDSDSVFSALGKTPTSANILELENGTEILTFNNTIFKYNINDKQLEIVLRDVAVDEIESIGNNEVIYRSIDALYYYNFINKPQKLKLPNDDLAFSISNINNKKCVIVGAQKSYLFNTTNKSFQFYEYDLSKFKSLGINSLFIDKQNLLWIATNKGLFKESSLNKIFTNKFDLHARNIYVDSASIYTAGAKGFFKTHKSDVTNRELILDKPRITSLCKTNNGFWLGDYEGNVFFIDNANRIKTIPLRNSEKETFSIYGLVEDLNGFLWVSTWKGLFVLDNKGNIINRYKLDETKEIEIIELLIDKQDNLWATTVGEGLYKIPEISKTDTNKDDINYIKYTHSKEDYNSLNSDLVIDIHMNKNGDIWIGSDFGMNRYNPEDDNFYSLKVNGQFFDRKIMAIETDANNLLWISTINKGLYVYNKEKETLFNLKEKDGLISNACLFLSNAMYKDELYFGTDEGVQIINTSKFIYPKTSFAPNFYEMIIHDEVSVTHQNLASIEQPITLKYNQNSFSISLEIADYRFPEKIDYFYKLNETTNFWTKVEGSTINFNNINYGEYNLLVKAAYQATDEAPIARLALNIKPPWYKSVLAYVLLFLGLAMVLFYFFQLRYKQKLASNKLMVVEELDLIKSNLFTNISHELRTPLTLISGPIENQLSNKALNENDRKELGLVKQNVNRLLNLVNQMLDLSLLDSGQLRLKIKQGNLSVLLKQIIAAFQYKAEDHNIVIESQINGLESSWYDIDVIEKVTSNLLSNAIKYSPKGSVISFNANAIDNALVMAITNINKSIGKKDLGKLFQRFYQDNKSSEGIGVGLALVKELVTLSKGSILVNSNESNKIQFTVTLPISKDAFSDAEIVLEESKNEMSQYDTMTKKITKDDSVLLIVEDDNDIRTFVTSIFSKTFTVIEAVNGKQGIEKGLKHIPDLIISDIMMPVTNGITLCNELKNNELTSHIPIILLTAKVGEAHEIEGLKTGADAYVTKPFSIDKLKLQVDQLIQSRKQLQKRFSKIFKLNSKTIEVNSVEHQFLERLKAVLDVHITEPDFNAEKLSRKMLMSRMQLHRKLKALTNLTTSEFLRLERLKLSLPLLKNSEYTIAEVAYQVGFNTPSYYIKSFKEVYKCTPNAYIQLK